MKPILYTAPWCNKCRAIEQWFPDDFQTVDVDDDIASKLSLKGFTGLPVVEFNEDNKVYIGNMSKTEIGLLLGVIR